jgi:hypothetical protein
MPIFTYTNNLKPLNMKNLSLTACIKKAKSLGLKEVTTPRQKTNGTIMFLEENGDKFGIYLKTGYTRRIYVTKSYFGGYNTSYMYPLNPRVKSRECTYKIFPSDHNALFNMLFKRFQ